MEDSCIKAFHELKSKRNVNTVIYRLSDNLETVVPDFKGNLTHDELLKALPAAETRFVVYDLVFATADGTRKEKIVLISWCPESVKVEQRSRTPPPAARSAICSTVSRSTYRLRT